MNYPPGLGRSRAHTGLHLVSAEMDGFLLFSAIVQGRQFVAKLGYGRLRSQKST